MPNYTQASLSDVYAAGILRSVEFGVALRAELQQRVPDPDKVRDWHLRIINLRMGLQQAALEVDPARRDVLLGYLQETYGLLSAALDPLLRAKQPLLSATGSLLVEQLLSINGFDVIINGFFVRTGYTLVPNVAPVYNTILLPTQTVGSVAYGGLPGSAFAFAGPVPTTPSTGRFLRLFVGTVQVGRVDFPSTLDGQGFSLTYMGATYYGTFQLVSTNELTLY